LTKAKVR